MPDVTFTAEQDLELAMSMAREAAPIALANFGFSTARRKHDGTLVTETDEAIDRLITERLHAARPGDGVLSEEQSTGYDPSVSRTWVIDPLDGTTNFARGLPIWGISVALLIEGAPTVGVVFFPVLGELFHATRGGGAFLNGTPIQTLGERLADAEMEDDQVFLECTRTRKHFALNLPFKSRNFGSATFDLCKVAEGCAVGGIEATPKLWDIGAAALILEEAGGALLPFSGEAIFPLAPVAADYGARSLPLIHAASAALAARVRQRVEPARGTASRQGGGMSADSSRTRIIRVFELPVDAPNDTPEREEEIGYLDAEGVIYRLRWDEGKPIGRVDADGRIYRLTTHGEREVGQALPSGAVQSAGLFAGGDAGWVDGGVVTQGGGMLGESEVGRVEGPSPVAAGAALLLIFLPDEWEAAHAVRD